MWFKPLSDCQTDPLISQSNTEDSKEFWHYTVGQGPITFHNQTGSNSWMKMRNSSGCLPMCRALKAFQWRCRLTLQVLKSQVPDLSNTCITIILGQHQTRKQESMVQGIHRTTALITSKPFTSSFMLEVLGYFRAPKGASVRFKWESCSKQRLRFIPLHSGS